MGNARKPGPVCSTRVGDQWIDAGTLCRTKTPSYYAVPLREQQLAQFQMGKA